MPTGADQGLFARSGRVAAVSSRIPVGVAPCQLKGVVHAKYRINVTVDHTRRSGWFEDMCEGSRGISGVWTLPSMEKGSWKGLPWYHRRLRRKLWPNVDNSHDLLIHRHCTASQASFPWQVSHIHGEIRADMPSDATCRGGEENSGHPQS